MKMEQSVPKRRNIKFRRGGITQKKAYNKEKSLLPVPGIEPRFFYRPARRLIPKLEGLSAVYLRDKTEENKDKLSSRSCESRHS